MSAMPSLFDELYPPDTTGDLDAETSASRPENELGQSARDSLVLSMQSRCRAEAVLFARAIGRPNEIADFESVALLAVVSAARYYDPTRGAEFASYATSWIRRTFRREASRIEQANEIESWDAIAGGADDVDEGGPDREASDRQPNGEQRILLSKLSPKIREVVSLCVFYCLTPDQISERLSMPLKDVKLAIRNAGETIGVFLSHDDKPNLFSDQFEQAWPEDDHAI